MMNNNYILYLLLLDYHIALRIGWEFWPYI